jgi:hypothetical protein
MMERVSMMNTTLKISSQFTLRLSAGSRAGTFSIGDVAAVNDAAVIGSNILNDAGAIIPESLMSFVSSSSSVGNSPSGSIPSMTNHSSMSMIQ